MSTVNESSAVEIEGDLFDAPEGSALIHACNIRGTWGAGIAKVFKKRYPAAYQYYHQYCESARNEKTTHDITDLRDGKSATISVPLPLGSALIIPPQSGDSTEENGPHWIICLFTSRNTGRRVDSPDQVVNSTYAALMDLKVQFHSLQQRHEDFGEPMPGKLFSCRFNSGSFAVPWERTRRLVEDVGLEMTVMYPAESNK